MTTKTIQINEATKEELYAFAKTLNLDVHHKAGANTLRDAINVVYDNDSFEVKADEQEEEVSKAKTKSDENDEVTITLIQNGDNSNQSAHPVGVNGSVMFIKFGEKSTIKRKYYDALVNAVEKYIPTDDQGNVIGDPIEKPRFAITTHSGV